MSKRAEIAELIWKGSDPFEAIKPTIPDFQGWASDHPYLRRAIGEIRPSICLEIGVWKGGSVITMAEEMNKLGIDGAIIAVDTWLGAWDHWLQPEWFSHLKFENGYPTIFNTFVANIVARKLEDKVIPLPLDSLNAAKVVSHYGIAIDLLHIDGGHDFSAVTADLNAWWPLLREGGILIGDDYHSSGDTWPEVRAAFQSFFSTTQIEAVDGKCYIKKKVVSRLRANP